MNFHTRDVIEAEAGDPAAFEWTPELFQQAKVMWLTGGMSAKAIGDKLGTTRGSVIGKMSRAGIEKGSGVPQAPIEDVVQADPAPEPAAPITEVPPEPPAAAPVEAESPPVPFMEAKQFQCRFPLWDEGRSVPLSEKTVCGCRVAHPKTSWCAKHLEVVAVPRIDRPRLARRI